MKIGRAEKRGLQLDRCREFGDMFILFLFFLLEIGKKYDCIFCIKSIKEWCKNKIITLTIRVNAHIVEALTGDTSHL